LIVWNGERDILEVVDSRATDEYGIFQGILGKRGEPAGYIDYPRLVKSGEQN
jgi:hypothetical protein